MDKATRGSRRVFLAFSEASPVHTTIRSPSRPIQTGTDCGEPSGMRVARCAKFGRSISFLAFSDSVTAMNAPPLLNHSWKAIDQRRDVARAESIVDIHH